MSSLSYEHALTGKGVGAGLPLRRGSKLYDVEPNIVYPNAFSTGLDSDLHAYSKGIYLRPPHLQITHVIEPYIDNHKAGGGNFTRHQFHVIKRGQPVMASRLRQSQIGFFANDAGDIETRTYADPAQMADRPEFTGYYTNGEDVGYALVTEPAPANATADDEFITQSEYDALPASGGTADDVGQDDYETTKLLPKEEFEALAETAVYDTDGNLVTDGQDRYRKVYEGGTDQNDPIATGGEDQRQVVEEALFGASDLVQYVEVDADSFYYGQASDAQGFIYPSSGGYDRVVFFNETDAQAGVTLPTDGSGSNPRLVSSIGNVTDVTLANTANFKDAAVIHEARPTIGFAHTDLEQATSHRFHHFSTGTDAHSPMRKGTLMIPFVDVVALKAVMADKAPNVSFDFTDISNGKSGLKVGVETEGSDATAEQNVKNQYSLMEAADSGYANLYFNFGAPFVTTTRELAFGDEIVPDLFGNYVLKGSGYFRQDAVAGDVDAEFGAGNASEVDLAKNLDTTAMDVADTPKRSDGHVCGEVIEIYDLPEQSMLKYIVNPQFQLRNEDALTEMYSRVRGADNAGLEPILADFVLMAIGGSAHDWASGMLPEWDERRQDLAYIIEDFVKYGVFGLAEIAADTMN